jgi:hypothetical protein
MKIEARFALASLAVLGLCGLAFHSCVSAPEPARAVSRPLDRVERLRPVLFAGPHDPVPEISPSVEEARETLRALILVYDAAVSDVNQGRASRDLERTIEAARGPE